MKDWKNAPLSIDYFIESGLLFEINRSILHLLGIALTVKTNANGVKEWSFKDCRDQPEQLVFDKGTLEANSQKLRTFMATFGNAQDDRRCQKLGRGVQAFVQRSDK